ncbi:MAG: SxtJ family membrane protein [Candidatus Omnitrophota bacterium]|nr:SxtJ family membrane protein [Candidatus Omnitrophota bacterium]
MEKNKISQLKEFGIALAGVLAVIALLPLVRKGHIRYWVACSSLIILALRLLVPTWLSPIYTLFLKMAHIVGKINSAILLSIIYYLLITPIGLIMRLLKQANFKKGLDRKAQTYWIKRDTALNDPKRMERQF